MTKRPKRKQGTVASNIEHGFLALFWEEFSVLNDVFEEHDAFAPNRIHKSLGRLYRQWLNTREALDPNFDRARYRYEMQESYKKLKQTPLGRPLLAAGAPTSFSATTPTSETNRKTKDASGKLMPRPSATTARSGTNASGGRSKTRKSSESGVEWLIVSESVSSNGSSKRVTPRHRNTKG